MKPLEKTIETKFVNACKKQGFLCLKLTPAGNAGWPDRLILAPNGVCAFAEIKRPGGKPRPLQELRLKTLKDMGYMAGTVDSEESINHYVTCFRLYAKHRQWE